MYSSRGRRMRAPSFLYGSYFRRDYGNRADIAKTQPRMTYASSKESLKNALVGIAAEVQANRDDEIEYETILKDISKGKR